jgi:carboxypeptidase Q
MMKTNTPKMIRLYSLIAVLFLWSAVLIGQEKVDLEVVHKIKKEGLNNSQVQPLAQQLTDYIGPRLSGSTNLKRGRQWAMEQFKEWGLSNIKEDAYGEFGKGWDIEKSYIAMKTPYYQQLIAAPKAWTKGTDGLVTSAVTLVKINSEEDIEKYRGTLKGKIVAFPTSLEVSTSFEAEAKRYTDEELVNMLNYPIGRSGGRWSPEQLAQWRAQRALNQKINEFLLEEGVALRLTGTRGNFGTVFHSVGGSYNPQAPESLPELEMSMEHYGRILRLIEAGHEVEVEAEVRTKFLTDDLNGYNVYAEIPGTDKKLKDEIVILGAHLDSWHAGTGANDNAAGVIVMMEAIRILKTMGIQPKRTIRIALWGEEEQGLYGSRGYVKKYVKNAETGQELAEYNRISAYYNLDNGSGKIRGIYTQSNEMLKPIFGAWFEPFHELGAQTVTNRNTGSTDHVAFDAVGIPGFQFIQDPIDYGRGYHTNMDVYERLMLDDMKQAAIIVASMVYHTAMRDAKLPRKQ